MTVSFKKLFEARYIKELESLILKAMEEKRVVSIKYNNTYREIEIYDFGETKTGQLAISAFQLFGGSQSKEPSGWKIFLLDEIQNIIIKNKTIVSPKPKWNPNSNKIFTNKIKTLQF